MFICVMQQILCVIGEITHVIRNTPFMDYAVDMYPPPLGGALFEYIDKFNFLT